MKIDFFALFSEPRVIKRTSAIPAKVKRGIRQAVGKIVARVAKDAKRNLTRSRTGLLSKALGSSVTTKSDETTIGKAGARAGFRVTVKEVVGRNGKIRLVGVTRKGKEIKLKNAVKATRRGDEVKLSAANYIHLVIRGHKKGRGKSAARGDDFLGRAAAAANRDAPKELATTVQTEASTE